MRLIRALTLLAAGSLLLAGQAEAKARPDRAHAGALTRIADKTPNHGMSALAREQARQRELQDQQRADLAEQAEGMRFGAIRRDYSLNVYRPTVRPDQDGAVGFSWRMKTHD